MEDACKNQYYLFLDECGDQNLGNFDPNFPIFTLCGIIMSGVQLKIVQQQVKELKEHFWGNKSVILHSRDIRKCEKGFEILFDLDVKRSFYEQVNNVMAQDNYTIISCSILKEPYIRQYGKLNDVYGLSLSFIIERTVFFLDSVKNPDIYIDVIVERRGKKEDANLLNYYNQLLDKGTYWVEPKRIKNYFRNFEMKWKREDIVGLQISDLAAYPITRFVLDENAVNPAYELIKNNIYTDNGKMYGQKVFPLK